MTSTVPSVRMIACLLVVYVSAGLGAQTGTLSGTVTYRERIALPPTAIVEVTLEDVSRADAPPLVVASARIERPRQVPVPFVMAYDAQAIKPSRRYGVRARILDGKRVLFESTDAALVLTQGHGSSPNLILTQMQQPAPVAPPAPTLPPSPLTNLPATFMGTLPCTDCQGIRYHLNLYADDSFFLRRVNVGKAGDPVDDIGSWALSSDRRVLLLKGSRGLGAWFSMPAVGVLRPIDESGIPITGRQPADLRRAPAFQFVEVRLPLRGAYSSMADAGRFVECSTGQQWPVAMEGANRELESGYAKARTSAGASVLVELDGRVASRTVGDGKAMQPALVVDKVSRWLPKERCAARFVSAPLGDTVWRLTHLAGKAVPTPSDPRRESSLIFDTASQTFSGSSGCNRIVGQFTIDQATMALSAGGTLMACRNEAQAEAALMAAIKGTRTYRITGNVLELMDDKGTRLARFEAKVPAGITVK